MENKNIIIGLTGSWASGCTISAKILEESEYKFKRFSLSEKIREEKIDNLREIDKKSIVERRTILQDLGNYLREKNGNDYLIKSIFEENEDVFNNENVVIDGIKNLGEHEFLDRELNNYYLININAPYEIRKRRQPDVSDNDFFFSDRRDAEEDMTFGQQVQRCVDQADLVLLNRYEGESGEKKFREKLLVYIKLLIENIPWIPTPEEMFMTSAYIISLKSRCIKRKVGAVIVKCENIIASGYNDVPLTSPESNLLYKTCIEEYGYCYRDNVKGLFSAPEYKGETIDKRKAQETKDIFNSHLDLCRAVHAEERSILQFAKLGGMSLENSIMYVTSFPCQLCSKKIIESGIEEVIYCEPYPNKEGRELLIKANVILKEFEGVKAKSYFKLFKYIIK